MIILQILAALVFTALCLAIATSFTVTIMLLITVCLLGTKETVKLKKHIKKKVDASFKKRKPIQ